MKTYQVWWCKAERARATEYAFLEEDFEWTGEMKATSPKDLVMRLTMIDSNESELLDHRVPKVGDVLVDDGGSGLVLTPMGVWASVTIVREEKSSVDE